MNPTEISEHAKEAGKWFASQLSPSLRWKGSVSEATTLTAIQHGINLAVESKDHAITQLTEALEAYEQQVQSKDAKIKELSEKLLEAGHELFVRNYKLGEVASELQSKDREIERLKGALSDATMDPETRREEELADELSERRRQSDIGRNT